MVSAGNGKFEAPVLDGTLIACLFRSSLQCMSFFDPDPKVPDQNDHWSFWACATRGQFACLLRLPYWMCTKVHDAAKCMPVIGFTRDNIPHPPFDSSEVPHWQPSIAWRIRRYDCHCYALTLQNGFRSCHKWGDISFTHWQNAHGLLSHHHKGNKTHELLSLPVNSFQGNRCRRRLLSTQLCPSFLTC